MGAGGNGGWEKVPHPLFSRGRREGVQGSPRPRLPTLNRLKDGGRTAASPPEDGGVGNGD